MTMSDENLSAHITGINERLRRLEEFAEKVAQAVGVPFGNPTDQIPSDVIELARADKRLEAIKRYRELTGVSMDEARRVVFSI